MFETKFFMTYWIQNHIWFQENMYKLCKELTNHTRALSFQQLFYFAKATIFHTSLDTKLY